MSAAAELIAARVVALRAEDARIEGTDENAAELAAVAVTLSELLVKAGYDGRVSDDRIAALWCPDPADMFGGFSDDVARLGLDEIGVREIAAKVFSLLPVEDQKELRDAETFGCPMPVAEFARIYPNIDTDCPTGGGCTAFYIPCGEAGAHALITSAEGDASAPLMTAVEGTLGFYGDNDGEWYLDTCWQLPFEAIEKFIDIQWALWGDDPMTRLADLRVEWIGNADRNGSETAESEAKMLREYVMEIHGGSAV